MSDEKKNSSQPAGKKQLLMTEEQSSRLYGLFVALVDLKERQKICEVELSKLIQELYPITNDEKQKEFIRLFENRLKK